VPAVESRLGAHALLLEHVAEHVRRRVGGPARAGVAEDGPAVARDGDAPAELVAELALHLPLVQRGDDVTRRRVVGERDREAPVVGHGGILPTTGRRHRGYNAPVPRAGGGIGRRARLRA
jgi:hypothetical protein